MLNPDEFVKRLADSVEASAAVSAGVEKALSLRGRWSTIVVDTRLAMLAKLFESNPDEVSVTLDDLGFDYEPREDSPFAKAFDLLIAAEDAFEKAEVILRDRKKG